MSDRHTKLKLRAGRASSFGGTHIEVDDSGLSIAVVDFPDVVGQKSLGPSQDTARRMVACWNACEGLYTESLERGGPLAQQIVDALNAAHEAKRQRDELLAALKELVAAGDNYSRPADGDSFNAMARYGKADDTARDIIAKVEAAR